MGERAKWRRIGQRVSSRKHRDGDRAPAIGLRRAKCFLSVLIRTQALLVAIWCQPAAGLWESHAEFHHLDAGQNVPISKSRKPFREFWTGQAYVTSLAGHGTTYKFNLGMGNFTA